MRSKCPYPALPHVGKWMDAEELLEFSTKVTEDALLEWGTGVARVDAAKAMLDATILNLSFGHFPPPRITCLVSTTIPSYKGHCL